MIIKQNISKEEMNGILLNMRKQDKVTDISTKLALGCVYFADIFALLLLFFAIKIKFHLFSALLIGPTIATFISAKRIRGVAVKRRYSVLLENFVNSQPDVESFAITVDDNSITVNDTLSLKWTDISHSEIFKGFIICVSKNNLAFPIKLDNNLKSEVCNALNNNKIDIIAVYSNKSDRVFARQTKRRTKKKNFLFRIFYLFAAYIPMVIMVVIALVLTVQSKNAKIEDFAPIYYNPQEEIVTQMASAFDTTRNAGPTFDLYYQFIASQCYNTMVKIRTSNLASYKTYDNNIEICFFDNDEYDFGLKYYASTNTDLENITYITADKSVHITGLTDGTFTIDAEKSDFSTWRNKFFDVLELDNETLNIVDHYYVNNQQEIIFDGDENKADGVLWFEYFFTPISVRYMRYKASDYDFTVMFSKNDESEIEKIKSIAEMYMDNSSKVDIADLIEVIHNFAVEKTDEYIAAVRETH